MTTSADILTTPETLQWQCIQVSSLRLAIPYAWTRQIVDSFEIANAPNAPSWLLGATNIDGRVVPTLDLAEYAGIAPTADDGSIRGSRRPGLLVGGEGDASAALAFAGLPSMRLGAPQERLLAQALLAQTAPSLSPYAVGFIGDAEDGWIGLDADQLLVHLGPVITAA